MPLNQDQIIELIKLVNKTDIGEVKIKEGDFSVLIRRKDYSCNQVIHQAPSNQVTAATPTATPHIQEVIPLSPAAAGANATTGENSNGHHFSMKSPMVGSFFRASGPDKEPFAKVGDHVEKGQVLCIIEAMKLFNEIESEISGTIVKVLAENASPVEYDQPLFLIDPQ